MPLKNLDKAPFPWFGGKSQAAVLVWRLLGDVPHYVEPFYGSGAVLLNRPHPANRPYYSETVNDIDGFVVNFWRAVQWYPEETAAAASWPVTEADKTARQLALLRWRDGALDRLAGDACWCDPVMAGWWAWAVCVQIGAFTGRNGWTADPVTGKIYNQPRGTTREPGVWRDMPHVSTQGQGVNHAGLREPGVLDVPTAQHGRSHLDSVDWGSAYHDLTMPEIIRWFRHLSARLRHVRVLNGDWSRLVTAGASFTLPVRQGHGPCAVFLDPPYADTADRSDDLYSHDSLTVAHDVHAWCLANGDNPLYRIVLAGFEGEHGSALVDAGWTEHQWFKAGHLRGGMGNVGGAHQMHRDRLWSSPHCLKPQEASTAPAQHTMFEEALHDRSVSI
jgi:DNA adenine methylase